MGGGFETIGANPDVACYFEDVGEPRASQLVAVVIQRGSKSRVIRRHSWLAVLRSLWPGRRNSPAIPFNSRLPHGWDGGSGLGEPHEILYRRSPGSVRVRGRDYPLPLGQTLVVMVDESSADPPEVTVTTRILVVPAQSPPQFGPTLSKDEYVKRIRDYHRAMNELWYEHLERDPVVSAFMGPTPGQRARRLNRRQPPHE
jgi:hypothetical protein